MLSEMQGSIESHINNAMKGAGGGSGVDNAPERRGSRDSGASSGDEMTALRSGSQRIKR